MLLNKKNKTYPIEIINNSIVSPISYSVVDKITFSCALCSSQDTKNIGSFNKDYSLLLCRKCARIKKCRDKYGVDNISQLPNHKEKMIATNREKFGKDFYSQTEERQEKVKQTNLEKYGVENVAQVESFKEKIKQTNLEKYGSTSAMKNEEISQKAFSTMKEKYGGGPLLAPGAKEKFDKTMKERYGDDLSRVYYKEEPKKIKELKAHLENLQMELVSVYEDEEPIYKITSGFDIKCHCGEVYNLSWNKHVFSTTGCSKHYQNKVSGKEQELIDFITSLGFSCQKHILKNGKHIDILVAEKNIGFEFDGLYWHSQDMLESRGQNGVRYHLDKTNEASKEGIRLIHIFEDEWDLKEDIVKSKVRSILGVRDKTVFARKTIISVIDNETKKNFLQLHHIQGDCVNAVSLGAFYENVLVGVMTFSTSRISLGQKKEEGKFELVRFATSQNVVGLASKMLSFFVKNYPCKEVFSYADKRWSQGALYEKMGFIKIRDTPPNYWYIINNVRKHRFMFRKSELSKILPKFDESKSEHLNMLENGGKRIWDCGNLLFSLKV